MKVEVRKKANRDNDYDILVNNKKIGRIYEDGIMLHCNMVDLIMNKNNGFFSGIQVHNEEYIVHDDKDGWTTFIKPSKDEDEGEEGI